MRVLICGGGTAGHVTPGIAIAEYIMKKSPNSEILFVGRTGGEENSLIMNAGYNLITLDVCGFKRSISIKNISAAMKILISLMRVKKVIKNFKPDIVIGTGGYVTWPVIKGAQSMRIPTMIHESNAYPGLTTRVLSRNCDKVLLNFEECKKHLKRQDNAITVGNPLRSDFTVCKREDARKRLRLSSSDIFILSFGGSGGAEIMNKAILSMMRKYSKPNKRIRHIHATGRKYFSKTKTDFPDLILDSEGCRAVAFINDMPTYMLACDIIISRAGAMTLSEISSASASPIIIPSPNVTDNHQYKNAKAYEKVGGGIVIEESELTAERLTEEVDRLVADKKLRAQTAKGAHKLHIADSREKIYEQILKTLE